MSAISTYLQRILNAIWARDVRQAIHDAIRQCYDDSSTTTNIVNSMATATAADVGKTLRAKAVSGGKVTKWEFSESNPHAIEQAVDDWLDEHPEATTSVEDASITADKFTDMLKLLALNDYVTPQMYGAVGNGIHDDTEAMNSALNSGYNVYIPTNNGEKYKITSTITITNANNKNIFSSVNGMKASLSGCILFVPSDLESILFDVKVQSLHLYNISINVSSNASDSGILINATTAHDNDLKLINCNFSNFNIAVKIKGRGCEVLNCSFASASHCFMCDFVEDEETLSSHPKYTGQRAIRIDGNRFHSITYDVLTVNSGHAFGLILINNLMDLGFGEIVRCNDKAYGWLISNNVFQGISASAGFSFLNGMKDCIISNNRVHGSKDFWTSGASPTTRYSMMTTILRISGESVENCIICGNTFTGSNSYPFTIASDIVGLIFSENAISNVAVDALTQGEKRPVLHLTGLNINRLICCNNVINVDIDNLLYIVNAPSRTISNSTITGNKITGFNAILSGSIGVSTTTDFEVRQSTNISSDGTFKVTGNGKLVIIGRSTASSQVGRYYIDNFGKVITINAFPTINISSESDGIVFENTGSSVVSITIL